MNEIKFAKLSRFQCVLLTSKNMRRPAHPSSKYSLQTRKCMNFFLNFSLAFTYVVDKAMGSFFANLKSYHSTSYTQKYYINIY